MIEKWICKIEAYMKQNHMVRENGHICAGISGGADSVCLFRILESLQKKMGFTLSVVHVEHGIRGRQSLDDMEFVRKLAETYGLPFSVYAYPVESAAKEQGISVEEAGRNLRYQAFAEESARYGEHTAVALAHHADDNAETILFHLCRGSGIEGLAGIRPVRGNIIRPLLCVTRKEIERYLRDIGQEYRTDATNADVRYSRNRIRARVMPELSLVNEQSVWHINQLAGDAAEVSEFLRGESRRILKERMEKKDGKVLFRLDGILEYPPVLVRQGMLDLIAEAAGGRRDVTREHAKALLNLAEGQTGKKISLPSGIFAEKVYNTLLLYRKQETERQTPPQIQIPLDGLDGEFDFADGTVRYRIFAVQKKDVKIPRKLYTKWFDYDKIKNRLYFRNRKSGDYFMLDREGRRQKLKDYWINEKVPKQEREKIPLLADGSHILWIAGGRISEYYKVTDETTRVLEVQYWRKCNE